MENKEILEEQKDVNCQCDDNCKCGDNCNCGNECNCKKSKKKLIIFSILGALLLIGIILCIYFFIIKDDEKTSDNKENNVSEEKVDKEEFKDEENKDQDNVVEDDEYVEDDDYYDDEYVEDDEYDEDYEEDYLDFGKVIVSGYVTSKKVGDGPGVCLDDCVNYVFFNILEADNTKFLKFIEEFAGNSYVSDNAIGLGCLENGVLSYYNHSDEFGEKLYTLTKAETEQIMNSSESTPIVLELERKKLSGGGGAPTCYSHITFIKISD